MKINHIGIAVANIEDATEHFKKLGYKEFSSKYTDEERKIQVLYLENAGIKFELVAPLSEDIASPVDRFIEKNKPYTMYHVCYEVEELEKTILEYKAKGYFLLEEPKVSAAMNHCRTTYMFQKNMGLVEFVEKEGM